MTRAVHRYWFVGAAVAVVAVAAAALLLLSGGGGEGQALSWAQLRNATYPSELTRSKQAPLQDGVYEEEVAPGSAAKLKVQLADIAGFGQIDAGGSIDAATVLIGSPGGSGTFIYLAVVLNDKGAARPVAATLLGDRVAVRSVRVEGRKITVGMRVRGPSDPLAVLTREVTRVYSFQGGLLEQESEQSADVPATPPDQFAYNPQPLSVTPGKASVEMGTLQPGGLVTYLVRGGAGQRLTLTLQSQFNNAILSVQGLDDLAQLVSRSSYLYTWSGVLPSTQSYAVTVITLAGNDLNYQLTVSLATAPTPPPTGTARPAATPTPARTPGAAAPSVPAPITGAFRPVRAGLAGLDAAAGAFLDGRQPTWGVAIASPAAATLYAQHGDDQFELASVVKVLIALAVMDAAQRENRYVDSFELSLLWPMITLSDNDSATKLWDQAGGGRGLSNYLASIGETGVKPYDGDFWGTSTASPAALATILARAAFGDLLNAGHRALFLSLLEGVTPAQRWGISAGTEDEGGSAALVGIKDGWYEADAGWRVNSVGFVVGRDGRPFYTIAVLSNQQPTWDYGIATIEGVATLLNSTLLGTTGGTPRP